jgi:signal transduction histidine kinase
MVDGTNRGRPQFAEEWLVAVLDSLSEGVIALDGTGGVSAANPAAERILGFRIADRRYDHWHTLACRTVHFEADGQPITPHPIEVTLNGGGPTGPTVVGFAGPDGPRWLSLATHVLDPVAGAGSGVVVSFDDVTERVQAEHELQRVLALLRGVLSATTHDLRGPLTAIHGYAQLLVEEGAISAEERDTSAGVILRQTEHLSRLVNDLSVVAGLEAGGVDVYAEATPVVDLARAAIEPFPHRAEIRVDIADGLSVLIDRDHGRRIVSNLVENAFKYGHPPVEITARGAGEQVEVTVADHGDGVPPAFVPHLFERFTRDPSVRTAAGSGLGLAIVAGLTELNGGEVRYEANDRGGARFTISVPAGGSGERLVAPVIRADGEATRA